MFYAPGVGGGGVWHGFNPCFVRVGFSFFFCFFFQRTVGRPRILLSKESIGGYLDMGYSVSQTAEACGVSVVFVLQNAATGYFLQRSV